MKRKVLTLDLPEDDLPSNEQTRKSCIESETTQLLDDHIKFTKEEIYIDATGVQTQSKSIITQFKGNLEVLNVIGVGSSGQVKKAQLKDSPSSLFALKSINMLDRSNRRQLLNDIKNFIQIQNKCKFIVQFHGAYYEQGSVHMLLEYMDEGSLKDYIQIASDQKQRISESEILRIIFSVVHAIAYLHHVVHMIHLDIKPANVLMHSTGQVKISDFGISQQLNFTMEAKEQVAGSYLYMSPERLSSLRYTSKADIWSIGVILLEMMAGSYPFGNNPKFIDLLEELKRVDHFIESLIPKEEYSPELVSLVKACLSSSPDKRPTAAEILINPIFESV